ncbi:protein FAR1-RELATED SEQUENCE 5-like [Carya illinoinensis]|uniref:protein FAR1-RELATED SEQUENCE 5-like n=1 Tax=Carya illinoinensis TaxID=32201 RepID=UPI001C7209C0|nr:protein FAR1-RELATED SEQUENCE 5-like [Carya illinoinensis]
MGIGDENPSLSTPFSVDPLTKAIPTTAPNFLIYMHGYYGAPPAWSPAIMPYPNAHQLQANIQMHGLGRPNPLMATSSGSAEKFGKGDTPSESAAPCSSSRVQSQGEEDRPDSWETSDGNAGSPQVDELGCGDMIEEPRIGMEFNSLEELNSYYKLYAKRCGFGSMTQRSERDDKGSVRYVTLGCARGGKARNKTTNMGKPWPIAKTDCKARINALKVDEKMKLTTVNNTHNHGLSPQKSRFFRCNREVSEAVKRVLDTNDLAGIRMNKSFGSLVVGAGGFENLPFSEKDCRNYIDKARHLRLGSGGAGALRDYFSRMQYKNPGFFYLMDLDDDGRLRNVFWADPRSRAAYQDFGDVVTFDTTYLTNRYGMPFAPFVGVNHHGQSILLGAGLISSEDTDTFIWLFQTWLQCMDGLAPPAIITDQDRAMKNAIAVVFPKTRHRFCLWHILKKVPEKLGSHRAYKSGLKKFEKSWEQLISTYTLQENGWLQSLYSERTYWVPVFLKEYFWAGMSTTQRSESMNAFFDGYVHAKTNLKEFVDQYDNALRKKIENEISADFHSFSVTIPCISRSPIEKRFQELYTNAKFREVQQQVMGVLDMDPYLLRRDGVKKTYLVEDEVRVEEFCKNITYYVDFNEENCEVKCSCGLFQMRGILCRHVLSIFKCNGIKSLPARYILDRWRKDIKWRYTLIHSTYDSGHQREDTNRYSTLLNICYQMITRAAGSKEHTEDATKKLNAMIELYGDNQEPPSMTKIGEETTIVGSSKQVLSPQVVRGKGRPPSLRRASRMEQHIRKGKAKTKKANLLGKRKERDGGYTPAQDTCRNLFGPAEIDGNMQTIQVSSTFDISGNQNMAGSQESVLFGLDGSQPVLEGLDGSEVQK